MLVCIMSAMMSESDLLVCIPQGRIKVVPLRGKGYRCIQEGFITSSQRKREGFETN